jgi:hypothetical protein
MTAPASGVFVSWLVTAPVTIAGASVAVGVGLGAEVGVDEGTPVGVAFGSGDDVADIPGGFETKAIGEPEEPPPPLHATMDSPRGRQLSLRSRGNNEINAVKKRIKQSLLMGGESRVPQTQRILDSEFPLRFPGLL